MILCIFSCTQDPKTKLYNEETVQEDVKDFTEEEKGLLMTYILRESMSGVFSGDTTEIDFSTKTYGEMISSQLNFLEEQRLKDSLERIEEEKRRVIFQQKQDSILKLVQFTVVDIFERKEHGDWGSKVPHIKVNMKSVEGKKVKSLKFTLKVFDKKGNNLGESYMSNSTPFSNEHNGTWSVDSYSDLYSVLKESDVEDYSYGFEIRSMIYDNELLELD